MLRQDPPPIVPPQHIVHTFQALPETIVYIPINLFTLLSTKDAVITPVISHHVQRNVKISLPGSCTQHGLEYVVWTIL